MAASHASRPELRSRSSAVERPGRGPRFVPDVEIPSFAAVSSRHGLMVESLCPQLADAGVSSGAGGNGGFDATVFNDFHDIFGDLFGFGDMFGGQGGRSRSRAQRGADLREDLTLEFEEAVFGVTKQVQVRRLEECDQCKGSGAAPGKAPITCTTCGGAGKYVISRGSSPYRAPAAPARVRAN